jgi:hypothetical protein
MFFVNNRLFILFCDIFLFSNIVLSKLELYWSRTISIAKWKKIEINESREGWI